MTPNLFTKMNPAPAMKRDVPVPVAKPAAVKKKILVVDDDPQIRESLHKVLCAEGYDVVLAVDGREAIEKVNTEPFDLLLLDVSLPDISGWDVFGSVTSHNPFLPVLIITGRNDQNDIVILSGAGALIEKPLDVPGLMQTIAETLSEPAETHLERLIGLQRGVRFVKSAHLNSHQGRSPAAWK